jgi:hypothetical protein
MKYYKGMESKEGEYDNKTITIAMNIYHEYEKNQIVKYKGRNKDNDSS